MSDVSPTSKNTAPTVSVLIVNYNSGHRLQKCLEHLEQQSFKNFEVLIIDNASADGSVDIVKSHALNVAVIHSGNNIGFAAGNNMLAKQATGEWLAFLNPDAYADVDWLKSLLEATQKYPWADAFGSTQIDALNPSILDGGGDVYHAFGVPYRGGFGHHINEIPKDGECFTPCAAGALYRRMVFERLNGFDERYFCYGEDVDLGFRLRLQGGRAVQLSNAVIHHEGSAVSGRYSDFTVYHGNRNRIWGWFLNMPLLLLLPLLPCHLLVNLYLLIRSYSVGIGGPYRRAMIDGYGGLREIFKKRKETQQSRTVSLWAIAKALTWSPLKVSRRASDLKPLLKPAIDLKESSL